MPYYIILQQQQQQLQLQLQLQLQEQLLLLLLFNGLTQRSLEVLTGKKTLLFIGFCELHPTKTDLQVVEDAFHEELRQKSLKVRRSRGTTETEWAEQDLKTSDIG